MSTHQKQDRLLAAREDLEATRVAHAAFVERAAVYRAQSAEPGTPFNQMACTNASVQFTAQAQGAQREILALTAEIADLERDLAADDTVSLAAEQVAAMDETAGVFA